MIWSNRKSCRKFAKNNIQKWKSECSDQNDSVTTWEFLKFKIREFSIGFSKKIAYERRNRITTLEKQIRELQSKGNAMSECESDSLSVLQQKLESEYNIIAKNTILKSKVQYYEEGEKCTQFFFNLEKRNKIKSTFRKLQLGNEDSTDQGKIMNHIKNFFQSKYTRTCNVSEQDCSEFLSKINLPRLSAEQARHCDGPLTSDEVLLALKSMQNGKSPGNDGLTKEFYVYFFDILGTDLVKCLNSCWSKGCLSNSQSQALITLIQKPGKDVRFMNAWRPISLINVDAKVISKVLAKRIEKFMPLLISNEQSAFVGGR